MHTLRLDFQKMDIERVLISVGMMVMESFGFIMLICGILGIKIF